MTAHGRRSCGRSLLLDRKNMTGAITAAESSPNTVLSSSISLQYLYYVDSVAKRQYEVFEPRIGRNCLIEGLNAAALRILFRAVAQHLAVPEDIICQNPAACQAVTDYLSKRPELLAHYPEPEAWSLEAWYPAL